MYGVICIASAMGLQVVVLWLQHHHYRTSASSGVAIEEALAKAFIDMKIDSVLDGPIPTLLLRLPSFWFIWFANAVAVLLVGVACYFAQVLKWS